MKLRKFLLIFGLLISLVLMTGIISCPLDDPILDDLEEPPPPVVPDPEDPLYNGTATAFGKGFASGIDKDIYFNEHPEGLGRDVTVTVTMVDSYITAVVIDGPDETPGFGGALMVNIIPKIIEKNSFNIGRREVDGMAGATRTYEGIKEGGEKAVEKIKAEEFDS